MYGLWYIVIASSVLMIIFILLGIFSYSNYDELCLGIGATFAVIFIICLFPAILVPIEAKKRVQSFFEQQQIIEEVIDASEELDNISITQTIIEMNKWLADAKASVKTYGCFSPYWHKGVENLEPIRRPQKE